MQAKARLPLLLVSRRECRSWFTDSNTILTVDRAAAVWACVMDWLHMEDSPFRRAIKDQPLSPDGPRTDAGKQA